MLYPYHDFQSFVRFFSAENTQTFLKKCYQKHAIADAEQKSYKNSYPFIYYLEHGQIYYNQAAQSPLQIQPVLLFYGLVHLIKACVLTVDPNYPENTSVLAHGVSSRKRKKQHYEFFDDEVKFQKSGLFPHIAEKLFSLKHLEGDKVSMGELFLQIPELESLFLNVEGKKTCVQVPTDHELIFIPTQILDHFHMSEKRFINYFQEKSANHFSFHEMQNPFLTFTYIKEKGSCHPLKFNYENKQYILSLNKGQYSDFPELLIHYLLLYNLGMIARYETEWWSELIKTVPNKDFPFISMFLNITAKKAPFLIYQILHQKG